MEIKVKNSKNISKIYFIESLGELWVFFKSNSVYVYNIDKTIAKNLYDSDEPSKYFYDNIRNLKYKKIY